VVAENPGSPLRWLTIEQARALVGSNNILQTLDRAGHLLAAAQAGTSESRQ
jgi:hypothetical protein